MINKQQKNILSGITAAAIISFICVLLPILLPSPIFVDATLKALLALWMQVSLGVVFWLFVTIAMLARHRFFNARDIDAAVATANSAKARRLQSILQNTLEQSLLAIMVYGAWIFLMPPKWIWLTVVFVALFSIGRLLFIARYQYGASARSFGFALTFIPSIILMVVLIIAQIIKYI